LFFFFFLFLYFLLFLKSRSHFTGSGFDEVG